MPSKANSWEAKEFEDFCKRLNVCNMNIFIAF